MFAWRIVFVSSGRDFRVQTVAPQSLFGVLTHKVLELVVLHGD